MILVRIETEKISPVIPESPVTRTKKYEIVWKTFLINTNQIYVYTYTHEIIHAVEWKLFLASWEICEKANMQR